MRTRSDPPDRVYPRPAVVRRIPGHILLPFLLFVSLGSFALGGEVARLPLGAFAAAIVRPSHTIAAAPGQLAQGYSDPRIQLVASGALGHTPTHTSSAPAKHAYAKRTRAKARSSARLSIGGTCASRCGAIPSWAPPRVYMSGLWGSRAPWASTPLWTGTPPWAMWEARDAWCASRGAGSDRGWND